jgi:ATP-dependent DNA helicase RecG
MTAIHSLDDIRSLRETWQVECKLAQGRDGDGALPEDLWETYSAFANTQGGDIFLGLRELGPDDYELAGIRNPHKVQRQFMEGVNDPRVVSANILCIDSVAILPIEGHYIIHINVPRAPVYLRPVYIGNDVLNGSYVRSGSADLRMDVDRVRRVQARVRAELVGKA